MKKKALALLTALAVMAMGTVTVMAESPTVGTTEKPVESQKATTTIADTATPEEYAESTTVSEGFTVEAVSETTVESAVVAVQNEILNDVASIGEALGDDTLMDAAENKKRKVEAEILSLVEVNADDAEQDEDGNYVVTMGVEGVSKDDTIAVLHYDGEAWETIVPDAVEDGSVTFSTASLSPIGIVKLTVTKVKSSPKTGDTMPVAVFVLAAGLCGAAVCGKKYFA